MRHPRPRELGRMRPRHVVAVVALRPIGAGSVVTGPHWTTVRTRPGRIHTLRGRDHCPAAGNLAAKPCLHHDDLASRVEAALAARDVPARLLRLELTESAFMAEPETAMCVLARLHALGVRFSIDDFGTGHSSMSYLRRLPVDELKIDRSFVRGMTVSADDAALVRSVINLGHTLDLTVVAEGVEDAATAMALAAVACDTAQGYQYDRPLPASGLARWLDGTWPPRRLDVVCQA